MLQKIIMEFTTKQKIGVVLAVIGAGLLVGLNWLGGSAIIAGVLLVLVGLLLSLRVGAKPEENQFIHDNTHGSDD